MAINYFGAPQDEFDPAELRRRRLLMPEGYDEVMTPDEGEQEVSSGPEQTLGYPSGPNTVPPPATAPTAMDQYKQALGNMPMAANYKPGLGRRFVGMMEGLAHGPEAQDTYVQKPYQRALNNWEMALKPRQALAGLEEKQTQLSQTAEYNRQRALALNQNAAARTTAAQSLEAHRKFEELHAKWEPTNEEAAIRLKKAGMAPQRDFAGELDKRLAATKAENEARIAGEDRRAGTTQANARTIAGIHESGANARNAARIAATTTKPKNLAPPSPLQQVQAEGVAASQLVRDNPKYENFVEFDGKGHHRVKGVDELPVHRWYNGVKPEDEKYSRLTYNQFLSDLKEKKKEILARPQPGDKPDFGIEALKDEEEE